MSKTKVGLLPLYIKLYDDSLPEMRPRIEAFYDTIVGELTKRGLDVVTTGMCRLKEEFGDAVRSFEVGAVDAIVTLHLAYSPSLESSEILAATDLPIVVLDTTPTFSMGPKQVSSEILYNHAIHGVQDMCNLLVRNGKQFEVVAGHWEKSDALDRVAGHARSARLARNMRNARVGRIGGSFVGMGDFAVDTEVLLRTVGVETIQSHPAVLASLLPGPDAEEVKLEMAADMEQYELLNVDPKLHADSVRAGIAVRRWIEKDRLTAFTANFTEVDRASGLPTMPFLEASKGMARGFGYAGEGDVITAALVGTLASVYTDVTFTEMFCPDWENDAVFLAHMGEFNIALGSSKAVLVEKPFPFTDVVNPIVAIGRLKSGKATLVDLAPISANDYRLILSTVDMLDVEGKDNMSDWVRGWCRPAMPIADFLSAYSRLGGTHHVALVYGDVLSEIAAFGRMAGWGVNVLGQAKT